MSDDQHDEHQAEHTEFDPRAAERDAEQKAPEHAGIDGAENDTVDTEDGELSIIEQWGGDYPPGSSLFCASFDPVDFDTEWGEAEFPEGSTVAIRRGTGRPSTGWIIRHSHLSDGDRTKAILAKFASPDALTVLYSLKNDVFDAFTDAWGKDGGMMPGKSNRSARRSGSTRRR